MSIILMDLKWYCHFDKPPRIMSQEKTFRNIQHC